MSDLPSYPQEAARREELVLPLGSEDELAGWGRRLLAYLVDVVVVTVAISVVFLVAFLAVWALYAGTDDEDPYEAAAVWILIAILGAVLVPALYYTILTGNKRGQTVGKSWLGIRVVDHRTHGPIGYARGLGRFLIPVVFGFFLLPIVLDYLWPLWDEKNQTLHDKAVGSIVVRA